MSLHGHAHGLPFLDDDAAAAAGGVAPSFDYATMPWLGRWDASDSSSLAANADGSGGVPPGSGATGRVADKTANNRPLVATAANNRPNRVLGGAPSGLDVLQHDAVDDYLATTAAISSATTTYILVARLASGVCSLWGRESGVERFYKRGDASDWGYRLAGSNGVRGAPALDVVVTDTMPSFFPATTVWNVWTVRVRPNAAGGTQTIGIYRDGTLVASTTAAVGVTALNRLFAVGATSSSGSDAGGSALWWGEALLADGSVSDAQIAQTEAALRAKWGTP